MAPRVKKKFKHVNLETLMSISAKLFSRWRTISGKSDMIRDSSARRAASVSILFKHLYLRIRRRLNEFFYFSGISNNISIVQSMWQMLVQFWITPASCGWSTHISGNRNYNKSFSGSCGSFIKICRKPKHNRCDYICVFPRLKNACWLYESIFSLLWNFISMFSDMQMKHTSQLRRKKMLRCERTQFHDLTSSTR